MTQQELIPLPAWPDVVVETIYSAYPRKKGSKPKGLESIRKALDRIVAGEIDGQPRTPAEAIYFLRQATDEARREMFGRMSQFVPHVTTYYNQSRYVRKQEKYVPEALGECRSILNAYPGVHVTSSNIDAYMPVLKIIDGCIRGLKVRQGDAAASYIRQRVVRFAECVAKWPDDEHQYIPGPAKFFSEGKYEQHERHWTRKAANGFGAEREQLGRIMGGG